MAMNLTSWASVEKQTATDLLVEHGGSVLMAIVKGVLIWGGPAMLLAIVLFIVGRRRGWVDIRGHKSRIARIVYGIVLFLGVVPLVAGAGVAHYAGKSTVEIVRVEVAKTDTVRLVGGVLVTPVLLAHMVVQGQFDATADTAVSWDKLSEGDLSFLLTQESRDKALGALTGRLIQMGVEQVPGYDAATDQAVLGWLVQYAERKLADKVEERIGPYSRLFQDVRPDAQGRLSFENAASAVGAAFWKQQAEPYISAPYKGMRWQLLLGAVLLLLLTIGLIQGIGRLVIKEPASAGE